MSDQTPTIVLVHGAFAESASWDPVVERLQAHDLTVVAAANPLRSVDGDAAYVRDVIASVGGPVVLVYGELDQNIPAALERFLAERAGAKGVREMAGGSHALSVSEPDAVAATILDAVATA
jgi:pimeloyl-ACP methyl ester carboxylesterase